jgi:hypothetical protein
MTSANQIIELGRTLNQVLDPGSIGYRQIQEARNPLGTAVLSVLTSRPIFWTAESLVTGYAIDIEDGAFAEVSRQEFRELFDADRFGAYVGESGFDPRDATLLGAATVLDSLLNVEMREAAMAVTVATRNCIRDCAAGDGDCVRRCLTRLSRL